MIRHVLFRKIIFMRTDKKHINIIFALTAAVLVSAAILSAIMIKKPVSHTPAHTVPPDTSMPENRPPVEMVQKLTELLRMSEADPQNADLHAEIGNIYYDLKEYEKAIGSYRKSLEIRPDNPFVETDLATCFYNLGENDKALETLDKVLRYRPGFTQAMYNKGIVLIHGKNDIKKGIRVWEELLQSDIDPAKREELQKSIQQLKSSLSQ